MTLRAARISLPVICAALAFSGCSGGGGDTAVDPSDTPPTITEATVDCDTREGRWTFAVTTDAWTGNGQVLLTSDGAYVEKHTVYSVSAAPDGTADQLELTLDVVPDWRDVVLGSSTIFNCGDTSLTGIVRVFTRDGSRASDCRVFGVSPERWAGWDVGVTCDTLLVAE